MASLESTWQEIRRLLDFRRKPPVRDVAMLAEFIEGNAAFVVQKGIFEYARARAGHYSKVLMAEPSFRERADRARWLAFPLGLAMVGEIAYGILRPHAQGDDGAMRHALSSLVLSVFDRHSKPPEVGADAWRAERSDLSRRLDQMALHPTKRAIDIPGPFVDRYFALMPIHEKLKAADYPTTRDYLRVTMCNVHDELERRIDAPAVAASLTSMPG